MNAYATSIVNSATGVPKVILWNASPSAGKGLLATGFAACHAITGVGDALANSAYASSLHGATERSGGKGFVAIFVRLGLLMMVSYWIGGKSE